MTIKTALYAIAALPLLSVSAFAGGSFNLSVPENVAVCAAKANDKIAVGDIDGARAMDCYKEGAVIRMFVPGNDKPVMSSEGAPNVYGFIQDAFKQFGYVATQHLVGSIYKQGGVVHSSVHATHITEEGTLEIGNAEYVDTVVKVGDSYKLASRDIHVLNYSKVDTKPVLRGQ